MERWAGISRYTFPLRSIMCYPGTMVGRPSFLLDLTFIDLVEWWLRLECCSRTVCIPLRYLAMKKPQGRLGDLILALRCRDCGQRPGRAGGLGR
jgi:hypothetical protein